MRRCIFWHVYHCTCCTRVHHPSSTVDYPMRMHATRYTCNRAAQHYPGDYSEHLARSKFCLVAPGESPARRSAFYPACLQPCNKPYKPWTTWTAVAPGSLPQRTQTRQRHLKCLINNFLTLNRAQPYNMRHGTTPRHMAHGTWHNAFAAARCGVRK
jgi:hypothetical protein